MNTEAVMELVKKNEVASRFFEDLAQREKNYRVTTVDQAKTIAGPGTRRAEIIMMFKQMEKLNLGSFVIGRRGGKSRFEWAVSMVDAGRAATGEIETIDDLDDLEPDAIEDTDFDEGVIEHKFKLRKGMDPIVISLPQDLTPLESKRLSRFISCLPFDVEMADEYDPYA